MRNLSWAAGLVFLLATAAEADYFQTTSPWKVHVVEVSPSDNPFSRSGTFCYLTAKEERRAASITIDKDGVIEIQAWLDNIDLPQEANFVDIYVRFSDEPQSLVAGDKRSRTYESEWKLENTLVVDASAAGEPGDVYLSHVLDQTINEKAPRPSGTPRPFWMDFVLASTLSFVSDHGEELAKFSLGNSWLAWKKLSICYEQIKDPGPRRRLGD